VPGLVDPVVDATAQVLDEGAEQAAVQPADGVRGIDDDLCCRHTSYSARGGAVDSRMTSVAASSTRTAAGSRPSIWSLRSW
jgi:hypothetical protein